MLSKTFWDNKRWDGFQSSIYVSPRKLATKINLAASILPFGGLLVWQTREEALGNFLQRVN